MDSIRNSMGYEMLVERWEMYSNYYYTERNLSAPNSNSQNLVTCSIF